MKILSNITTNYKKINRKKYQKLVTYVFFRYQRMFFGSLIFRGKKLWAYNFFNLMKYELKNQEKVEPDIIFFSAMLKITPRILLLPYMIGRKKMLVPLPITITKRCLFATKWVIKLMKEKNKKITIKNIIEVLIGALYDKGLSIEKKENYYKEGIKNKSYIKYFKR